MNHLEGTTRFSLKDAVGREHVGINATYSAQHSTPGATGTTLKEDVRLEVEESAAIASIQFDDCVGQNADEALDRLACRLERIALAIRNRKPGKLPAS